MCLVFPRVYSLYIYISVSNFLVSHSLILSLILSLSLFLCLFHSPVKVALESLKQAGVSSTVFSEVRVEPNDKSLLRAIRFAREGNFDGFLAIGGGSVIDTAKAANLYSTYPDHDFLGQLCA